MSEDFYSSIEKLLQGTEAHLVSDVSTGVMHDRQKVVTPIPQLNCIFGGGIPMGIIIEAYGEPASGKSSTWYQTLGNFQKAYPENLSIIVDTEASVDSTRMKFMGCNPNEVLRIPATSIEAGFNQVFKILDGKVKDPLLKDKPVFIIWDTIGIGVTDKQLETGEQFCFTGDTPVKCLDGKTRTMREMMEAYESGEDLWVYSYDLDNKKIVPGKVICAGITGKTDRMLKVILDDGFEITCTSNHRFMTRDGKYIEAKDLTEGQSLMPMYWKYRGLYDKTSDDYEYITSPIEGYTHHIMCPVQEVSSGYQRHHKDLNKRNNNPDNIEVLTTSEHRSIHTSLKNKTYKMRQVTIERNKSQEMIDKVKASWDDERREKFSERSKEMYRDIPERMSCNRPECRFKTDRSKYLRRGRKILDEQGSLDFENYLASFYQGKKPYFRQHVQDQVTKYFGDFDHFVDEVREYNHKVVKVEEVVYDSPIYTYDIEVEDYHNFLLPTNKGGTFVHQSGGMLEKAKTLKFELSELLPRIEQQPIVVVLLNQVTTQMGRYGSSLTSGGGWGLKHNAHLRLKYTTDNAEYENIYHVAQKSHIDIEKSKISPRFKEISLYIDVANGGLVNPLKSMIDYSLNHLGYISMHGKGWYNFSKLAELNPQYSEALNRFEPSKNRRMNDLVKLFEDNEFFLPLLELTFCEEISRVYTYQAEICKGYMEDLRAEISNYIPENAVTVAGHEIEYDEIDDGSGIPIISESERDIDEIEEI